MHLRIRMLALLVVVPLIVVMFGTSANSVSAETLTLTVEPQEGMPGDQLKVSVSASNADDLGALQAEVTFDPNVLDLQSVSSGELAGEALVDFAVTESGTAKIGIATLEGISGDGELLILEFQVVGGDGDSSTITLGNGEAWKQESHARILVDSIAGQITVTGDRSNEASETGDADDNNALPIPNQWIIPLVAASCLVLLLLFWRMTRRPKPKQQTGRAVNTVSTQRSDTERNFCSECGAQNKPGAKFCSACGTQL